MTQQATVFQEDVTSAVDVILQDKLEKSSITEQVLSSLREELKALQGPIQDRQRFAIVQGAITKATNYRNNIVRICKKGRENALMEQRAWIAKEKELVSYIEEDEKPLRDAKQAYLDEQERIEREAAEAKERMIRERFAKLEGFGFVRVTDPGTSGAEGGDSYVLRTTSLSVESVMKADAETWGNMMLGAEQVWREEQDRIAAEQEAKRQEEERLRKEREELAAREAELARREKQMQDAINAIRKNELLAIGLEVIGDNIGIGANGKELFNLAIYRLHEISDERWRDELLAAKAAVEERNLAIASAKEREKQQARYDALISAGYNSECGDGPDSGCSFTIRIDGKPFAIDHAEAYAMSEDDFAAIVRKGHEEIQRRKLREQEAIRQQAIEQERQRQEAEAKRKAEDEERRKAQLSDAQKWQEWVAAVESSAPKMSSEMGKHAIRRVINGIVNMTPGLINDLNK